MSIGAGLAARMRGQKTPGPRADTAPLHGQELLVAVRRELARGGVTTIDESSILAAMEAVNGVASGKNIGETVQQLATIQRELTGLGPLADVLMDPAVTDVLVNPDGTVWVDRGRGVERSGLRLAVAEVSALAVRLASACGARLDDAKPYTDGVIDELPPGIAAAALRMHAVLSPPARGGASISLRALRADGMGLVALARGGMMNSQVEELLRRLVHERKNLLITGGTGTGKTTLLAALLGEVPECERTLLVEDTPELLPNHPNVVALTTKAGNADGAGAIGMQVLLRQALRMRPDRIVVGEIRGAEIADLLVALNTGHAGSAGTMHANSVAAVPGRLTALGAMAGMPADAVHQQAADGVDYVVHLARVGGQRRVAAIARLHADGSALVVEPVWGGLTDV